jgi:hypothetical protein
MAITEVSSQNRCAEYDIKMLFLAVEFQYGIAIGGQ